MVSPGQLELDVILWSAAAAGCYPLVGWNPLVGWSGRCPPAECLSVGKRMSVLSVAPNRISAEPSRRGPGPVLLDMPAYGAAQIEHDGPDL